MGIGSLAIGIGFIILGFGIIILPTDTSLMSDEDEEQLIIVELILALPSIAIGGLFLRKYDKDKKKEKKS
jgi:hypothetical protein